MEELSLVERLETPELVVVVVLVVVVEINSCTTSAPAPSTAEKFPVTLTDKLVSPKALEACDKKGALVDKLERLKAAIPTDESSEDILSSNVTTPLSAKRRASETEMETAPGGNREALATTRAKFSCAVRSKPRVRPSKRKVCLKPTTCKVQSFNGKKEPCK